MTSDEAAEAARTIMELSKQVGMPLLPWQVQWLELWLTCPITDE